MKLPKEFEFYVQKEIVRKSNQDKSRAEFLIEETKVSFNGLKERVETMGINRNNANSIIKDCHDIIMETIRAKMLLEGLSASGNFAHEAEVSYFWKLGFKDDEVSFLNELRYFRNSINYYGKILNKEYAQKVFDFLKKILEKLKKEVKNV